MCDICESFLGAKAAALGEMSFHRVFLGTRMWRESLQLLSLTTCVLVRQCTWDKKS